MSLQMYVKKSLDSSKHRLNTSWIIYSCYFEDLFFRKYLNRQTSLSPFIETFKKFNAELTYELKIGRLSRFVVDIILNLIVRITQTSKAIQVERLTNDVKHQSFNTSKLVSVHQTEAQPVFQHCKYAFCQQFFIDNIAYPYPADKNTKEAIAMKDGVTVKQVDQWFSNHRKRSGWNDICNISENKETASTLVKTVLIGNDDFFLPHSVTKIVVAYIQRATNSSESIPSEWLAKALAHLSYDYPFLMKKSKRNDETSEYLSNLQDSKKIIRFVNNQLTVV